MESSSDEVNADGQQIPEWLDKVFFENLIKNTEKSKYCEIKNFVIKPGTTKNAHYATIVLRAIIDFELKAGAVISKSFIIKTEPVITGQQKDLYKTNKFFETEIKMYTEALPKIECILNANGDKTKLCASILYYTLEPYKCIIFEDLCEKGYTPIPYRHCTLEEVKAALLKLSKLHAVSFKLGLDNDISVTNFKDGSFNNAEKSNWDFVNNAITHIMEVVLMNEELIVYRSKFEKISENLISRMSKTYNAYVNGDGCNGIFALNHGDFHFRNMMIKTNQNGELNDLMLLDYQISVFATPAIDVIFAMIMLFSPEMRLHHRDELLYYYFINFQDTLKLIGYNERIPTIADFQYEILKCAHFELFLVLSFLMFNYVFADEDGDLVKAIENDEYRAKIWQSQEVVNELKVLLPRLLYKGAFEEKM